MGEYWIIVLAAPFGIGFAFLLVARWRMISPQEAREALEDEAILVDVRTAGEYASGHLRRAINIPVDQLSSQIEARVPVKDVTLLCHCASGMRAAAAASKLKRMGYTRAYNLGSFKRAASIVER